MFVGNPAGVVAKVTCVGIVTVEGKDRDETNSRAGYVEDVLE
jgi:hypothetical protein